MSNIQTIPTASEIATNLTAFGLTFVADPIHEGVGAAKRLLRKDAPVVKIMNVGKFLATVPDANDILVAAMDGSSIRVQSQRVVRDELVERPTVTNEALRHMIIDRIILRNKAPRRAPAPVVVKVELFIALDGKGYTTKLEARQASVAVLVENGMSLDQAQAMTANMAE